MTWHTRARAQVAERAHASTLTFWAALASATALACALALAAPARAEVVDDFESAARWKPMPADGVVMKLSSEPGLKGNALRVDFEFTKGGGYAVLRRDLDLALPANYRFTLNVRGVTGPQNLEFKLVDSTGANVWWSNRRDFVFPDTWQTVATKKRHISFAWGPAGGGELRRALAIEFAITAGSGGKGTVWLDELTLDPLPPDPATPPAPAARAFSSAKGHPARAAVDGDSLSFWRSGPDPPRAWLELDLGIDREFGGLIVDWAPGAHPPSYDVEGSLDGRHWRTLRRVRGSDGGRDWLYLPESEARTLRIKSQRPGPVAIREVRVMPLESASSRTAFFEAIARGSPRGLYPRAFTGEQAFWSVVGADHADDEALLGEDGALETGAGEFSIEPFLFSGGKLLTWADARVTHELEHGRLPLPVARWFAGGFELEVRPAVSGSGGTSSAWVRYVVRNDHDEPRKVTLFLALRPFQVNPPVQFLNLAGGAARLDSLSADSTLVRINERRALVSLVRPTGFGATTFDAGDVTTWLARGKLPPARAARDPFGAASGALAYELEVPERNQREVFLLVPLGPLSDEAMVRLREVAASPGRAAAENAARAIVGIADNWRGLYDRASVELPDQDLADTFAAQLGWILVNRDGAAIQPGSRSYARSWIRDGSLTSSALLRLGHADAAQDFLEWFAPYQYADGKVPCCVDRRGSDPVPEHDSHGELIWLAAESFRITHDRAVAGRMWPHVRAAALHLDSLRALRRTPEWRTPENAPFFGLLPPSISHEGYSAKPMHSYWDDLFALRGFKDAAFLAGALGKGQEAARFARSRDEFEHDLGASVRAAMKAHGIDFIPGCADLGDFDATSTTIALSPVQAEDVLPQGALERTFERYWDFFVRRRDGVEPWDAFTPYEIRNVGAFVRLGWRDRANQLLKFFMDHRRPAGWRQWPEVVYRDARSPRFLGDLPHTWVGSDFVRSVLEMLAYERERDEALVIAAGVPESWLAEVGPPVRVRGIATRWGRLGYTLRRTGEGIELKLEEGLTVPRGGLVVSAPGAGPGWRASLDGRRVQVAANGEVVVRKAPFTLTLAPR